MRPLSTGVSPTHHPRLADVHATNHLTLPYYPYFVPRSSTSPWPPSTNPPLLSTTRYAPTFLPSTYYASARLAAPAAWHLVVQYDEITPYGHPGWRPRRPPPDSRAHLQGMGPSYNHAASLLRHHTPLRRRGKDERGVGKTLQKELKRLYNRGRPVLLRSTLRDARGP